MRTLLRGGRYFDGTSEDFATADILVEDGIIARVGEALDDAGVDEVVDVTGRTVLPGFIDTHVHVMLKGFDLLDNLNQPFSYQYYLGARNLGRLLDIGITTARDASGADLGTRRALADGLIDGPELQITIIALSQTGGHGDFVLAGGADSTLFTPTPNRPSAIIDGPEQARQRVRELIRNGADAIKVNTSGGVISPRTDPQTAHLSPEELEMIVREARRAGVPVMAHSHGAEAIVESVRAGVSSIEHGSMLDDEGIALMLERGTWLIPTLMAVEAIIDGLDAGMKMAPGIAEKARMVAERRREAFQKALAAGVRIAFGSDCAGTANGNNLTELALLNEMGMSAMRTLRAATSDAAEVLGVGDRLGQVREGYQADLVVVDGDPLAFRAYPANIRRVIKRGRTVREFA